MNGQRIQQLLRTLGTFVVLRLWPALCALVLRRVWPLLRPLVVQRIWPVVRGHAAALWNRLPLAVRKMCLVTWWRTRSALHILATLVMLCLERLRKRLGSEEDGT